MGSNLFLRVNDKNGIARSEDALTQHPVTGDQTGLAKDPANCPFPLQDVRSSVPTSYQPGHFQSLTCDISSQKRSFSFITKEDEYLDISLLKCYFSFQITSLSFFWAVLLFLIFISSCYHKLMLSALYVTITFAIFHFSFKFFIYLFVYCHAGFLNCYVSFTL